MTLTSFSKLVVVLALGVSSFHSYSQSAEKPNVLFITIDDMNDWTSVFNKSNPIKTPNIAKLAERGAFFTHAYVSSPACNPSRASVMTGTRPHKTGIYGNKSDWRNTLPASKTIQRYFRDNGYFVCGSGKVFHHFNDWAYHDNASFNEFLMMAINEPYPDQKLNGLEEYGSKNLDWGAWPDDISKTADYRTAEYAIQKLEQNFDQPFFLNVGIYKPHSPFFAPQEYFDRYPSEIQMPVLLPDDRKDLPDGANELLKPSDHFWSGMVKALEKDPDAYKNYVRSYQACASFADDMIGKIIDALDKSPHKENTIIILWSDHGFHLGEKEHFEKFALWEKTTHIPFIVIAPGVTKPHMVIDKPVDMASIYPTLAELCGLKIPSDTDGISLVPLLKNPDIKIPPALMTYMKGNHAVRTERWRYIQYSDGTEELYDHSNDPNEWFNVAGKEKNAAVIEKLKKYIPNKNADQVPDLEVTH
ncbi:sulfatase [Arenibacter aquaticus]|nr:sulfatase [Arenibacter aquaticus]